MAQGSGVTAQKAMADSIPDELSEYKGSLLGLNPTTRSYLFCQYNRATHAGMNFKWHSSATRLPVLRDHILRNIKYTVFPLSVHVMLSEHRKPSHGLENSPQYKLSA